MKAVENKLKRLYAKIPSFKCKGKCQEVCGPLGMSYAEHLVLKNKYPDINLGVAEFVENNQTHCSALQDGRCTIYEDRPMTCRIWGAVKELKCPWGCGPAKYMSKEDSHKLMAKAEILEVNKELP